VLASSIWRHERHSLWLRREFFKAKRKRALNLDAGDNPIGAFVQQRREAVRKKALKKAGKAASDLARSARPQARPLTGRCTHRRRQHDLIGPQSTGHRPGQGPQAAHRARLLTEGACGARGP